MKSLHRAALVTCLALVTLTGCKKEEPAPDAAPSAEASGAVPVANDAGLSASQGKLVLPAVKGRPGAAYFMVSNSGAKAMTLTGVAIAGAGKAEMHETKGGEMSALPSTEVPAGDMIMFERGGKHVMVFDLPATLKPGGTAQATLGFADGTKLTVPLAVEAAGGGSGGDMEGMAH